MSTLSPASRMPLEALSGSTDMAPRCRPIPRVSFREGLLRYRNDRVDLLAQLGDDRVDIVKSTLGPVSLIVITEIALAQEVLLKRNSSFIKGPGVSRHAKALLGNGLLTSSGDDHRAQRKVLAPKFKPTHIAGFADTMLELTTSMLDRWATCPPEDFDREISSLTMSIAARTMFGSDVTESDIEVLYDGLRGANQWIIDQSMSPLPLPLWVPTPRNVQMKRTRNETDSLVRRLLSEHRAKAPQNDVLSALLAATDADGIGMSDEQLRDQIITFFIAGHETISTTLGWAYRLLCERPELADTIAAEADEVFGPVGGTEPRTTPNYRGLVVTRAVLQEIMRLRPAAYMLGRQAIEDVRIGEHQFDAGDYVVVNTLGIQRHSDYFDDPLHFRHERFLKEPTWPRNAYQPFGSGRRVCIGNHFAMLEGTIVLSRLCQAMRFHHNGQHAFDPMQGSDGIHESNPMITLQPTSRFPFALTPRA